MKDCAVRDPVRIQSEDGIDLDGIDLDGIDLDGIDLDGIWCGLSSQPCLAAREPHSRA